MPCTGACWTAKTPHPARYLVPGRNELFHQLFNRTQTRPSLLLKIRFVLGTELKLFRHFALFNDNQMHLGRGRRRGNQPWGWPQYLPWTRRHLPLLCLSAQTPHRRRRCPRCLAMRPRASPSPLPRGMRHKQTRAPGASLGAKYKGLAVLRVLLSGAYIFCHAGWSLRDLCSTAGRTLRSPGWRGS